MTLCHGPEVMIPGGLQAVLCDCPESLQKRSAPVTVRCFAGNSSIFHFGQVPVFRGLSVVISDNNSMEFSMARRMMKSYQMIPERFKEKYFKFYEELYHEERSVLDIKTKELVSIAASLAAGCKGCFKGHVIKAIRNGATREEIGESIAIAMGIQAAAIVDQTDIAFEEYEIVRKIWENAADGAAEIDEDEDVTP